LIGALVGLLFKVDEATSAWEVLKIARLHIRIPVGEVANLVKNVRIIDTLYQVVIVG